MVMKITKTVRRGKKQSRRNKEKYPALKPELNLKTRQDELNDIKSYVNKLNDKEKEWLNKFASEYILGSFPKKTTKAYRKRLHKTKKLEKSCYDRNNSRNRDVLSTSKACGKLSYGDVLDQQLNQKFDKIIEEDDDYEY